jgi:transcriptional regulator with XRE-family HTH domain
MNTQHRISKTAYRQPAKRKPVEAAPPGETAQERVIRIYRSPGGPLVGWLFDEARRRDTPLNEMADALGVTYGYISQLRNGIRSTENIGHEFAQASSVYLGVPTIVIKLIAGQIRLSDFLQKQESEADAIERAFRNVMDDIRVRMSTPVDLSDLPIEAKRAMVLMHAEVSGADYLNTRELPGIVYWLSRAMVLHDEASFEAQVGHRDTDARPGEPQPGLQQ